MKQSLTRPWVVLIAAGLAVACKDAGSNRVDAAMEPARDGSTVMDGTSSKPDGGRDAAMFDAKGDTAWPQDGALAEPRVDADPHACQYGGEDHPIGETWRRDDCNTCECKEDMRVECTDRTICCVTKSGIHDVDTEWDEDCEHYYCRIDGLFATDLCNDECLSGCGLMDEPE